MKDSGTKIQPNMVFPQTNKYLSRKREQNQFSEDIKFGLLVVYHLCYCFNKIVLLSLANYSLFSSKIHLLRAVASLINRRAEHDAIERKLTLLLSVDEYEDLELHVFLLFLLFPPLLNISNKKGN